MKNNNKTILITGGSRGIGQSIALKFAKNNYNVAITYSKNKKEANKTLSILNKYNIESMAIKCDFLNKGATKEMYNEFRSKFSKLNVLINNAGWTKYIEHSNLDDLSSDLFNQIIKINLKTVYLNIKHGIELMEGKDNCIINISSIAGYNGVGSNIAYCAAKAGVNSLTKSFSQSLGPNIRVNGIAPGLTETEMTSSGPSKYYDNQKKITPLGRIAKPNDIADAAYAIVNDMKFINGKTIIIDGGRLI